MAIELTTATEEQLKGIYSTFQIPSLMTVFPQGSFNLTSSGIHISTVSGTQQYGEILDFNGCKNIRIANFNITVGTGDITTILNASQLESLEDVGTLTSIKLSKQNLSDTEINKLFTDLPSTTKTATIDVSVNPGSATCDPTIATAKGYTVVT